MYRRLIMSIQKIAGFGQIQELSQATKEKIFRNPDQSAVKINAVATSVIGALPKSKCSAAPFEFLLSIILLNEEYNSRYKTTPFKGVISKLKTAIPRSYCQLDRFKAAPYECRVLELICDLSGEFKKASENAEFMMKGLEEEALRTLTKFIEKNKELPPQQLGCLLDAKYHQIRKSLFLDRLGAIISRLPEARQEIYNQDFKENCAFLMESLMHFRVELCRPVFVKKWAEVINALVPQKSEPFCEMLQNYSTVNPEIFIPEAVGRAQKFYLKPLNLKSLCSSPDSFREMMAKRNSLAVKKLPEFFDKFYKNYLMESHLWLSLNLDAIKKSYSQGDDPSRNQDTGTCLQNSLERHILLLEDPRKNATRIAVESTQAGRVINARVKCTFQESKLCLIPAAKCLEIQATSCKRLGLVCLPGKHEPVKTPDELEKLLNKNFSKANLLGLLKFNSPEGGHVINIQIDHTNGIFRIIDDNIGVCEWPSYDKFSLNLRNFLKAFYPGFSNYLLEVHAKEKTAKS
jgi:hypothetical protein